MNPEEQTTEDKTPRFGDLHISWKGLGEEALQRLSTQELTDYVGLLEASLESIHRHFYYFSPPASFETEELPYAELGFDGDLQDVASTILRAALCMYRVHATPFRPVPVPDGVQGITRLKTKA